MGHALKFLNTVFRDHPFNTVRAAELQRWAASEDYAADPARGLSAARRGGDQPLTRTTPTPPATTATRAASACMRSRGRGRDATHATRSATRFGVGRLEPDAMVKVLIVGGGGREHALAWKFKQDDPARRAHCRTGNPGIAELARCVAVAATDIERLSRSPRASGRI